MSLRRLILVVVDMLLTIEADGIVVLVESNEDYYPISFDGEEHIYYYED